MLTLSSMDIKNQEFKKSLRGLDESEVSAFLASVATQWQEQQDEMRRTADRVAELESKIEHYQRIEEALQEAISTAKSSTAAAIGDAERRGQLMVEEANLASRQITSNAVQENERLKTDSARLMAKKGEISARLRAFLTSELELLEHFDRSNPRSNDEYTDYPSRPDQHAQSAVPGRSSLVTSEPVRGHSEMRRIDSNEEHHSSNGVDSKATGSPDSATGSYADEISRRDSGSDGQELDSRNSNSQTRPERSDSRSGSGEPDVAQNVHAMPATPERAPQSRSHDWQPSIARASAAVGTRAEAAQHPELDNSWPSDTEEVTNPNADPADDWDGDSTEPDAVFGSDADGAFFNPEEPYNVSEDELEKIRRILDDLD